MEFVDDNRIPFGASVEVLPGDHVIRARVVLPRKYMAAAYVTEMDSLRFRAEAGHTYKLFGFFNGGFFKAIDVEDYSLWLEDGVSKKIVAGAKPSK